MIEYAPTLCIFWYSVERPGAHDYFWLDLPWPTRTVWVRRAGALREFERSAAPSVFGPGAVAYLEVAS